MKEKERAKEIEKSKETNREMKRKGHCSRTVSHVFQDN